MMSEHPELPDLIRKTGVPVPQVLDRSGETLAWKPAEDMAPKLDDLLAALGTPEDAKQTDPAQAASTLALLKGLIDVVSKRATEATLAAIQTALTDGTQKVQLSGTDVVIGLLADRPPASEMRGKGYYAWDETDGHKLKYSDGTNWVVNQ